MSPLIFCDCTVSTHSTHTHSGVFPDPCSPFSHYTAAPASRWPHLLVSTKSEELNSVWSYFGPSALSLHWQDHMLKILQDLFTLKLHPAKFLLEGKDCKALPKELAVQIRHTPNKQGRQSVHWCSIWPRTFLTWPLLIILWASCSLLLSHALSFPPRLMSFCLVFFHMPLFKTDVCPSISIPLHGACMKLHAFHAVCLCWLPCSDQG